MMKRIPTLILVLFISGISGLTSCSVQVDTPTSEESISSEKLKVVATTTIVADVISQVGGDMIDLSVLLPVGTDPHGFSPTPQDIAKVAEADLIFANGVGLEGFIENLIESAGATSRLVTVSDGIDFLVLQDEQHEDEQHEGNHVGAEPHTWTDPNNVIVWVRNIEQHLSKMDPGNALVYKANAQAYQTDLRNLDTWIRKQVAQIPAENRKLVTDHTLFGYFATEYGLEQVGALIPGYSTMAEPTAKELAGIEDAIRDLEVKAVFVGNTVNPILAERITQDTGTALVFVYTGSLSESGGEAGSYIEYMRYNTAAITNALTPNP